MNKGQVKKKWKNEVISFFLLAGCGIVSVCSNPTVVFAAANTSGFDNFISFICEWLVKIGVVIAMIGGIQMAIGFKQEDPDAKVRGLQTLAAGFMVAAIGQGGTSLFG
ncbi:hypothetical protein [Sinanaerobacter sp. ZZT-01]|uniref:hypothetical protein n=1 Tax=Sinanaerobacter sp. ZZT-01 TaxID=3111540 RepID=UPI002D7A043F|nr:hypothetical protein [Sinanaerobacter sp. ZZT-01]WRR94242.1 hypothetical protein U5921_03735 [Sinanaerobacter sp. ZZT-01]